MPLTRRQILHRSLAAAATVPVVSACGGPAQRSTDPIADPEAGGALRRFTSPLVERDLGEVEALMGGANFPLGVAAGDIEDGHVRLWTRFAAATDEQRELYLWVRRLEDNVVIHSERLTGVANQVVQVTLEGLTPGTRLRYCFVQIDADEGEDGGPRLRRSDVGEVVVGRADDDLRPMRIGATACTSNSRDLSLLTEIAAQDLDCFISLGDTVYADRAESLAAYRGYWAHNLSSTGYRALRSSTALYATWDDHEVTNNWNPEEVPSDKVEAAREAFFEHLPRDLDPVDPSRVWRSRRYGNCAEIFLLDSRSERTPSRRLEDDAEYISRAQLDWLKESLRACPARFKIIANSVPIAQMPFPMSDDDRWQGWVGPREEILTFIDDEEIEGVVWLAGDIHMGYAGRTSPPDFAGERQLEICAGPGAQFTNPLFPWFAAPQFDFATGDNNWVELELDPVGGIVRVRFWGANRRLMFETSYSV